MSSPTPARKPRPRKYTHFERPAQARSNHPIPRAASDIRQCIPLRAGITYAAILSLAPVELPPGKDGKPRGSMVHNASLTRTAQATARHMNPLSAETGYAMPRRTVGHCVDFLVERGLLDYSETHSKNSSVGRSFRIVPWLEVQQRWRDNPDIGNVDTNRNLRFVWGKGKDFLTPQNLIDWKVDVIQAKASANAQAACVDLPQPTRAQAPAPPPQQRKARMTVQEEQIADVAVIHRALMDNWIDSVPEHAAALLAIARKVEASIPASAVADLVHQLAMKYVNKARGKGGSQVKITWSVGWFLNDIDGAVHLWKHNRDAAQRATGTGQ